METQPLMVSLLHICRSFQSCHIEKGNNQQLVRQKHSNNVCINTPPATVKNEHSDRRPSDVTPPTDGHAAALRAPRRCLMLMALFFPASPPPTTVGGVSAQRTQPVLDGGGLYYLSGSKTRDPFIRAMNSCPSVCALVRVSGGCEGNTGPCQAQQPSYFTTISLCSDSWRSVSARLNLC